MATVKMKMYYVGQGAMNLIWVVDDRGAVSYAALFDAGSTSDPMHASGSSTAEVDGILKRAAQIDIFVTHLDADHYNYLGNLDNSYNIRNWYLGSVSDEICPVWTPDHWRDYFCENFPGRSPLTFPENYIWDGNNCLTSVGEAGLEIICLMTNWGDEVNDRTAIYVIRTSVYAVIIPGDMTGNTFLYMESNGAMDLCREFVKNRQVIMAVPHHGALTTLLRNDFVTLVKERIPYYDLSRFRNVLTKMGARGGIFLASGGLHSGFHHPRLDVMLSCELLSLQTLHQQKYICYRDKNEALYALHGCGWISRDEPPAMGRGIYATIENKTDAALSYITPVSDTRIKDHTQKFGIYSYEAGRLNGENGEPFELTAYDFKQRPVFRERFCREEGGLVHMERSVFCAEKGEWR